MNDLDRIWSGYNAENDKNLKVYREKNISTYLVIWREISGLHESMQEFNKRIDNNEIEINDIKKMIQRGKGSVSTVKMLVGAILFILTVITSQIIIFEFYYKFKDRSENNHIEQKEEKHEKRDNT